MQMHCIVTQQAIICMILIGVDTGSRHLTLLVLQMEVRCLIITIFVGDKFSNVDILISIDLDIFASGQDIAHLYT